MGLVEIKERARRAIHRKSAVAALYKDDEHPTGLSFLPDYAGPGLLVRYHTKIDSTGDLDGSYGEVIDGIDRLVFLDENVAEVSAALVANAQAPLSPDRGAVVTIEGYKGMRFTLDAKEPPDGPLETIWTVARQRA